MKLSNSELNIKKAFEDKRYSYVLSEAMIQKNCGSVYSTYILGVCAQYGYGQSPDIHLAVNYYEEAIKSGNDEAAYELGKLLLEGIKIEKDINRAIALLNRACTQCNIKALNFLGQYYESRGEIDKAIGYYQKAERTTIEVDVQADIKEEKKNDMEILEAENVSLVLGKTQLNIDERGTIHEYKEDKFNYNVQLPSVNGIGSFVFYKKSELRNIFISYCKTIGNNAFSSCEALESVNFIVQNHLIAVGSSAFYNCVNLKFMSLPDSVSNMGADCFYGCSNLKFVKFPAGMDGVRSRTFYNCYNLERVIFKDKFADSNYNAIGKESFYGCNKLKMISLPSNLRLIEEGAFGNCAGLEQVIIPDSVEEIGASAFYNCTSLQKVIISKSVSQIGEDAFAMCKSLKKIIIPKIFKSKMKKIFGKDLFSKDNPRDGLEVAYI